MERPALPRLPLHRLRMYLVELIVTVLGIIFLVTALPSTAQTNSGATSALIKIDDFESYKPGTFPDKWVFVKRDKSTLTYTETREEGETVEVRAASNNHYLKVKTKNEALRYTQRNGYEFDWSIEKHPRIAWRWRAIKLPAGASERGKNDTGGALYVTFGADWIGRPKSIKYTYSSSLPVGTIVEFGPLKVIVVDSAREPNMGKWEPVMRNVRNDYRQVFGGSPPDRPVSITFWSDSDTTGDEAEVHFDDIRLLPPYQRDE